MKQIDPIQIQALVDGELDAAAASAYEKRIEGDPDALAMRQSLRSLRETLRHNEPCHRMPVSPDFYWSGIERRIREAAQPTVHAHELPDGSASIQFLIRRWLPIFGTLGLVLALSAILWLPYRSDRYAVLGTNHDIENTSDEVSTMSFRSESEGITVVWVAPRETE